MVEEETEQVEDEDAPSITNVSAVPEDEDNEANSEDDDEPVTFDRNLPIDCWHHLRNM